MITGPNMSGKTTFLKQIATLQIMAQIGSFVPAEFAALKMCDKIFTRIALNDNIKMTDCTTVLEIRELSYILNVNQIQIQFFESTIFFGSFCNCRI